MARRPWMVEDPDGRGWFDLTEPRVETAQEYAQRVSEPEHTEYLDSVLDHRRSVAERMAVEDIDRAAAVLGAVRSRMQQRGVLADPADEGRAQWVGQQLAEAKQHGRDVLTNWEGWSGDQQTDRLIAHSREILSRAVADHSDAAEELERADAIARWSVDDEVALSDADGVLDGWQW